jgi:hypothetical protein
MHILVVFLGPLSLYVTAHYDCVSHLGKDFCLEKTMHIDWIIEVKDHFASKEFEINDHYDEEIFIGDSPLQIYNVPFFD